jgi:hypothetical protein
MRLFTRTLSSGSLTIDATDGVTMISVQSSTNGSATITGNVAFKGLSPTSITIASGQSFTITTPTYSPLDGVTIAWVSGSADIVIGM